MERTALSLAREFTKRRWTVRSVFAAGEQSAPLMAWCHDQGVAAETHPAVRHVTSPHTNRDLLALRRLVRESRPRVVNLHYGSNFISYRDIVAVRLAGVQRCVVTVHQPEPWAKTGERKRMLTRIAAQLCNAIIVPSHAMKDILLEAGIPSQKIHVVLNGVRVPDTFPARSEARMRLGLPHDAFVVGTLARLEPHKGIRDLIEGAARVPDPSGQLRVVVAGEGSERPVLQQLATSRLGERALFLGRVRDTADLYAASDVFALPSYLEGFGLVYIEAAFHGVPSIGTNVGGIPDAIVDGETGFLVPPHDPDALSTAISRMRDEPGLRLRLGGAARARAYTDFTETHMADGYEQVFRPHA